MKVAWITCPQCDGRFYVHLLMLQDTDLLTGTKPFCHCPWCGDEFRAADAKKVET